MRDLMDTKRNVVQTKVLCVKVDGEIHIKEQKEEDNHFIKISDVEFEESNKN